MVLQNSTNYWGRTVDKLEEKIIQQYRRESSEAPDKMLDTAILEVARKHAEHLQQERQAIAPFTHNRIHQMALAASLVVTVGLVVLMQEQYPDELEKDLPQKTVSAPPTLIEQTNTAKEEHNQAELDTRKEQQADNIIEPPKPRKSVVGKSMPENPQAIPEAPAAEIELSAAPAAISEDRAFKKIAKPSMAPLAREKSPSSTNTRSEEITTTHWSAQQFSGFLRMVFGDPRQLQQYFQDSTWHKLQQSQTLTPARLKQIQDLLALDASTFLEEENSYRMEFRNSQGELLSITLEKRSKRISALTLK